MLFRWLNVVFVFRYDCAAQGVCSRIRGTGVELSAFAPAEQLGAAAMMITKKINYHSIFNSNFLLQSIPCSKIEESSELVGEMQQGAANPGAYPHGHSEILHEPTPFATKRNFHYKYHTKSTILSTRIETVEQIW